MRRLRHRIRYLPGGTWQGLIVRVFGLVVLVSALLAVIVYLPPLAIDHPRGLGEADRLKAVQDLRTTLLQGLGGLALLGTLYFSARTLQLNRRGQLTERFTKAIEQLGSETLAVRLGGIYALESIALDSAGWHWSVMEVITAYLREHSQRHHLGDEPPGAASVTDAERLVPADHRAIGAVIGRRRWWQDPTYQHFDLHLVDLRGVRWEEAHLEGAFLMGVWLDGARLSGARLIGAHLELARLVETSLFGAHLEDAQLDGANLERAVLISAHLRGASLRGAKLTWADLSGVTGLTVAQLESAADLAGVLLPANLKGRLAPDLSARVLPRIPGPPPVWPSDRKRSDDP